MRTPWFSPVLGTTPFEAADTAVPVSDAASLLRLSVLAASLLMPVARPPVGALVATVASAQGPLISFLGPSVEWPAAVALPPL